MVNVSDKKKVENLIVDLFWEYDRMSSSGQETLDKLAELMNVLSEREEFFKSLSKEIMDDYLMFDLFLVNFGYVCGSYKTLDQVYKDG